MEWPEHGVIRCWDCQQLLIERVSDDVRQLCDAMAFDWATAPDTMRRDAYIVVCSRLNEIDRRLFGELKA